MGERTMRQQCGAGERVQHERGRGSNPSITYRLRMRRCTGAHGPAHFKYHLAPDGLKVGDVLQAGADAPIHAGSVLKLRDVPMGVHIHNIELVGGSARLRERRVCV